MRKYFDFNFYKGISGDLRVGILSDIRNFSLCIFWVMIWAVSMRVSNSNMDYNYLVFFMFIMCIYTLMDNEVTNKKSALRDVLPITDNDYFNVNFISIMIKVFQVIASIGIVFIPSTSGKVIQGMRGGVILFSILILYLVTKRNIYVNENRDIKNIRRIGIALIIIVGGLLIITHIDSFLYQFGEGDIGVIKMLETIGSFGILQFIGSKGSATVIVMGIILFTVYYNYTYIANKKNGKDMYFSPYFLGVVAGELKREKFWYIFQVFLMSFMIFIFWGSAIDGIDNPSTFRKYEYSIFLFAIVLIFLILPYFFKDWGKENSNEERLVEILPLNKQDKIIARFIRQMLVFISLMPIVVISYIYPINNPLAIGGRGLVIGFLLFALAMAIALKVKGYKVNDKIIINIVIIVNIIIFIIRVIGGDGIMELFNTISYSLISTKIFQMLGSNLVGAIAFPIVIIIFCYVSCVYIPRKQKF